MATKTYVQTVADRLNEFGQKRHGNKYGWKSAFARELDIPLDGLSNYLNGRRLPGYTTLARLYAIGCSSDWLLYGDDYKLGSGFKKK